MAITRSKYVNRNRSHSVRASKWKMSRKSECVEPSINVIDKLLERRHGVAVKLG